MKDCTECGNPIPDAKTVCPFCNRHQTSTILPKKKAAVYATVNLEQGLPSVEKAILKMERDITQERRQGAKVLRVIHGWGSSGTGGKIKEEVHRRLESLRRKGVIKSLVPGEAYSELTNAGRELLQRYPDIRKTLASDRNNLGITFVEL